MSVFSTQLFHLTLLHKHGLDWNDDGDESLVGRSAFGRRGQRGQGRRQPLLRDGPVGEFLLWSVEWRCRSPLIRVGGNRTTADKISTIDFAVSSSPKHGDGGACMQTDCTCHSVSLHCCEDCGKPLPTVALGPHLHRFSGADPISAEEEDKPLTRAEDRPRDRPLQSAPLHPPAVRECALHCAVLCRSAGFHLQCVSPPALSFLIAFSYLFFSFNPPASPRDTSRTNAQTKSGTGNQSTSSSS